MCIRDSYISTRYPTDIPDEVTVGEARQAAKLAQQMYTFIDEQVDEELARRQSLRPIS